LGLSAYVLDNGLATMQSEADKFWRSGQCWNSSRDQRMTNTGDAATVLAWTLGSIEIVQPRA
jgi:hypothetical protein